MAILHQVWIGWREFFDRSTKIIGSYGGHLLVYLGRKESNYMAKSINSNKGDCAKS